MSLKAALVLLSVLGMALPGNAWFFFSSSGRQEAEIEIDQACIAKAERGACDFYTCFDARHPCDRSNYALSYGWRYCTKFDQNYQRFSREGKNWINATRVCSMAAMLEFYREQHINCEDVEAEMKRAHAQCEVQHGICDLDMMMDNKEVIHDIYYEQIRYSGLVRLLYTVKQCGQTGMQAFTDWILDQMGDGMSFFTRIFERLGELDMELPI